MMTREMTTTAKRELDRANGGEATRPGILYRPATDIFEANDHVVIAADMPGVAPDGVEVTLERQRLTIRGHVMAPAPEGYRQVYAEYGVGDYERVFTLSEEIDRDHINASFKDGVLMLELPKSASAKARRIEVRTA